MSYDLRLSADPHFSQATDLAALRAYILSLPHITGGGRHCVFQVAEQHVYMEIDLEEVDAAGNAISPLGATRVNCIACHIPYAFFPATVDAAYNHLVLNADYLGWPVYDLQTGETWE